MSATILPLFWQLASSKPAERHASCALLVKELVKEQAALLEATEEPLKATASDASAAVKDPSSTTDEEALSVEEQLKKRNASNVFYSLVRLVKGLASPRESSRLGFSVAFTELLSHLDTVSPREVLVLLLKHSTPHGNIKGQEERDLLFARLFGIEALVQSGLLFSPTSSSLADFERALEVLINLRNRKKWLAESAAWVVVQALRGLAETGTSLLWKDDALRWVAKRFLEKRDLTPEKLAIVLTLQSIDRVSCTSEAEETSRRLNKVAHHLVLQANDLKSYIVPPLKNAYPLSNANLSIVGMILKDATPPDSEQEQGLTRGSTGSWKAQLHFVWDIILDTYYPPATGSSSSTSPAELAPFPDFFRQAVDEALFAIASSPERKSWGFQVFQRALVRVPQEVAPQLFTPNFMRTWINHLAGSDRLLHKAAMLTANVVQQVVERDPHTGFALISQLMGQHGSQRFDEITRTKTVEQSLARLDIAGVQSYIAHLEQLACSAVGATPPSAKHNNNKDTNLEPQRKWAFDQLHSLVRNTAIPKNDDCIMDVLRFFALHGYVDLNKSTKPNLPFAVSRECQIPAYMHGDVTPFTSRPSQRIPTPPFSPALKAACRSRFLSCLSDLNDQTSTSTRMSAPLQGRNVQQQSRSIGLSASGKSWLSIGNELVQNLEADTKRYTPIVRRDEEAEACRRRGFEMLEKIDKLEKKSTKKDDGAESKSRLERLHALRTLLLATLLVTYEEEEGSVDITTSVVDAVELLLDFDIAAPSNTANVHLEDEDREATPMEVLVDVLISTMERPSAFLRSVAGHVFGAYAAQMTNEALSLLLGQLQSADAENADDEEGGEMDVDDEEPEGGDDDDDETSATSETDDEEDEEDAVDNAAVDPQLRSQVLEALKDIGLAELDVQSEEGEDGEKDSDSNSDSDISNMDDEQMMRLDDKLGEIFRLQSKKHGGEGKRDSVAFQNKMLDLLDIFARKVPSTSPLLLQLVEPLFALASTSLSSPPGQTDKLDRQVAQRARGLLVNRVCQTRLTGQNVRQGEGMEWMDDLAGVLEEAHVLARNATSGEASALASSVNILLTGLQLLAGAGDEASDATAAREVLQPPSDPVLDLYVDTLSDFASRKASAVKPAFIVDAFRRYPRLGWALKAELLATIASEVNVGDKKAVTPYRQLQVMGMLHTALQGVVMDLSLLTDVERGELVAFLPRVHGAFASIVVAAAKDSGSTGSSSGTSATAASGVNAARVKEIIKCGLQIVRLSARLASSDGNGKKIQLESLCPLEAVKEMANALESSSRFSASKSLLDLCRQMSAIIEKGSGGKGEEKTGKRQNKEKRKREGALSVAATEAAGGKRKKVEGAQ